MLVGDDQHVHNDPTLYFEDPEIFQTLEVVVDRQSEEKEKRALRRRQIHCADEDAFHFSWCHS